MALESDYGIVTNLTNASANQAIVPPLLAPPLLAPYWNQVHEQLGPFLESAGKIEMTATLRRLAQILEIVRIEEQIPAPVRGLRGRPALEPPPSGACLRRQSRAEPDRYPPTYRAVAPESGFAPPLWHGKRPQRGDFLPRLCRPDARGNAGQNASSAGCPVRVGADRACTSPRCHGGRGAGEAEKEGSQGRDHRRAEKKTGRPKRGEMPPLKEPTRIERQVGMSPPRRCRSCPRSVIGA